MVSALPLMSFIEINQEDLTKTAMKSTPVFIRVERGRILHGSDKEEPQLDWEK